MKRDINNIDKDGLTGYIRKAIKLLCDKNISEVEVLIDQIENSKTNSQ